MDGTNKSDVLTGTAGADVINAGNGADTVSGGDGNDILHGDNGNDTLDGGLGADFVFGDRGDDTLIYFVEADALGNDVYNGGQGSDTLVINLNNMALPENYADSAALKQALTDYFNSHVGQTMDFSSFNIHLTATNLEHLVLQGDAVAAPPAALAGAWTDTNGDHHYTEGVDTDIAIIVDTNGDHVISAGDQVKLGGYPTSFDGSSAPVAYGTDTLTITGFNPNLNNPDQGVIAVDTQEGYTLAFVTSIGGEEFSILQPGFFIQNIVDGYPQGASGINTIQTQVSALTPTPVSLDQFNNQTNDSFIDVSFNIGMV